MPSHEPPSFPSSRSRPFRNGSHVTFVQTRAMAQKVRSATRAPSIYKYREPKLIRAGCTWQEREKKGIYKPWGNSPCSNEHHKRYKVTFYSRHWTDGCDKPTVIRNKMHSSPSDPRERAKLKGCISSRAVGAVTKNRGRQAEPSRAENLGERGCLAKISAPRGSRGSFEEAEQLNSKLKRALFPASLHLYRSAVGPGWQGSASVQTHASAICPLHENDLSKRSWPPACQLHSQQCTGCFRMTDRLMLLDAYRALGCSMGGSGNIEVKINSSIVHRDGHFKRVNRQINILRELHSDLVQWHEAMERDMKESKW